MAKRQKSDKSRLSDVNDMTEQAAKVTGKSAGKTFSIEDTKDSPDRTPGLTAKNRAKFTTMLRPDLREKLQNAADNYAISIADVLETVIEEYFGIKEQ